jgi:metallophosphoesterase (TIGR00282 family)
MMRVLFFGDVVGKSGRKILNRNLSDLKKKYDCDFVIVNGENSAGGLGITPDIAEEFFIMGVDVLTSGNHIWKHKEICGYLDAKTDKIIRPLNYPSGLELPSSAPGLGYAINKRGDAEIVVINIMGRTFVEPLDCPFRAMDHILKKFPLGNGRIIIVDFHAETTSEKMAMGWHLDGRVSGVFGTHTHVQTSDERILQKGTAYITDTGMCGAMDTVLGVDKDIIVQRFLTQRPITFKFPEHTHDLGLNAVFAEIDETTGKAVRMERIFIRES